MSGVRRACSVAIHRASVCAGAFLGVDPVVAGSAPGDIAIVPAMITMTIAPAMPKVHISQLRRSLSSNSCSSSQGDRFLSPPGFSVSSVMGTPCFIGNKRLPRLFQILFVEKSIAVFSVGGLSVFEVAHMRAARTSVNNQPDDAVEAISKIAAVPTILQVICATTGMGFAAVARVTEDRWIACASRDLVGFGLGPGGELKIETTICNEIRQHRQAVIIDSVDDDPVYAKHHTPAIYGLQSYISIPIILSDGSFFGTLCAIDATAKKLNTPETIGMFELFAQLIATQLEANDRIFNAETSLRLEHRASQQREEFIAVLGHDLRNPLASISAGVRRLGRSSTNPDDQVVVELIMKSVTRMAAMIDDVLDLARSRLGSGIGLKIVPGVDLKPTLDHVIDEFRSAHPERPIVADIDTITVSCDPGRVAQLLSNLISNALTYGTKDEPVTITARQDAQFTEISVTNLGADISAEVQPTLFQPFVRGEAAADKKGLGLGLYIAAQIAKAHRGKMSVLSGKGRTVFRFVLANG